MAPKKQGRRAEDAGGAEEAGDAASTEAGGVASKGGRAPKKRPAHESPSYLEGSDEPDDEDAWEPGPAVVAQARGGRGLRRGRGEEGKGGKGWGMGEEWKRGLDDNYRDEELEGDGEARGGRTS